MMTKRQIQSKKLMTSKYFLYKEGKMILTTYVITQFRSVYDVLLDQLSQLVWLFFLK